jgi:hypothetical protein
MSCGKREVGNGYGSGSECHIGVWESRWAEPLYLYPARMSINYQKWSEYRYDKEEMLPSVNLLSVSSSPLTSPRPQ